MAKSNRPRGPKNQISGTGHGALLPAEPGWESALEGERTQTVRLVKSSLFNAELEEVIEIIARERVYRMMLSRLGRNLLGPPPSI